MVEKKDDIKQLFSHLGLNPSDYQEIRSAPSANATVSEAPRRWSLLQSAASVSRVAPRSIAPATMARPKQSATVHALGPVSMPAPLMQTAVEPPVAGSASNLPAALLAAAQDIARAELMSQSSVRPASAVAAAKPVELPAALSKAFAVSTPANDLQSLFQSVREPQAAPEPDVDESPRPAAERRTDQLHVERPVSGKAGSVSVPSLGLSERVLRMPPVPAVAPMPATSAPQAVPEAETRHMPPLSRLGPMQAHPGVRAEPKPAVTPVKSPAATLMPEAPASWRAPRLKAEIEPNGNVRLKLSAPVEEPAASGGESLRDVFQRLSGDNRS